MGSQRPERAAAGGGAEPERFRALGDTARVLISLGGQLARLLDQITRRNGSLTLSQYQLLGLLRSAEPDPREPWELGRGLGSGSAHVTMLLDQLERAGLLERGAHGRDRRRRWVHLTDAGRERVDRLAVLVRAVEDYAFRAAWTAAERRRATGLATRLEEVLEELTPDDPSFLLNANPGRPPERDDPA